MARYEVFATSWDDPHIVEELLPARGLSFSMPLSDHGSCSFSATVEPGRSLWRAAVGIPLSGLLVARDGVPVWSGWVTDEQQTGPRTFQFSAKEWGSFFARTPARVWDYRVGWTDQSAFRDLVEYAQAQAGQDVKVATGTYAGGLPPDLLINSWETTTTEAAFRRIADADGGPEWYFGTTGTIREPVRRLMLGDRLGESEAVDVLHYVEQTEDWHPADDAPGVALLSDLFPAGATVQELPRRGGNVLALSRSRNLTRSATRVIAIGDGSEAAQLQKTATAGTILSRGWPLLTEFTQHSDVGSDAALQRLANADLAAMSGIATRYSLTTMDGDPDWTMVPRGSTMRVLLDTDVYATSRPYSFDTRLLSMTVSVDDDTTDGSQVTWDLAETMEAS